MRTRPRLLPPSSPPHTHTNTSPPPPPHLSLRSQLEDHEFTDVHPPPPPPPPVLDEGGVKQEACHYDSRTYVFGVCVCMDGLSRMCVRAIVVPLFAACTVLPNAGVGYLHGLCGL